MWLISDPEKYKTHRIAVSNVGPYLDTGIPINGKGVGKAAKKSAKENRRLAEFVLQRLRDAKDGVVTQEEVERCIQEIVSRAARANTVTTTAHVMIQWLWGKLAVASPRFATYASFINTLLVFLGSVAKQNPARVLRSELDRFFLNRAKSGLYRRATIKDNVKAARSIFRYAKEVLRVVGIDPAAGLKVPKEATHGFGRDPFKLEEIKKFIRYLHTIGETGVEWLTLVLLAVYTGMRLVDALNLTWEEIDLIAEVIQFDQEKLKHMAEQGIDVEVTIPIHIVLLERLRYHANLVKAAGRQLAGPIVPYLQGRGEDRVSGAFIKLLNKADIRTEQKPQKGFRRKPIRRGFHCFRHWVITWLKKKGVSEELRKEFVGHSEESKCHEDYDHSNGDVQLLRTHVISNFPDVTVPANEGENNNTKQATQPDLSNIPIATLLAEVHKRCSNGI